MLNLLRKVAENGKEQFGFGGITLENRSWCGQIQGWQKKNKMKIREEDVNLCAAFRKQSDV